MSGRNRIVGTGLIALDVIIGEDDQRLGSALGGSTGNVLSILGALGWTATPVTTLGDDTAGKLLCSEFEELGADLRFLVRSGNFRTPVVYQHQLSNNCETTHRFSFTCPRCGVKHKPSLVADTDLANTTLSQLTKTDVFFLDRPTATGCKLAEAYARKGALVVFEPSELGEDPNLFLRALRCAHIVKYADERLTDLDSFDLSSIAIEIQTMGANGLRFRIPYLANDWFTLGAYHLPKIADTAGAGDWCTAGLIYSLLHDGPIHPSAIDYKRLAKALDFGQALSSLNCMTLGARGLLQVLSPNSIAKAAQELSKSRFASVKESFSILSQQVIDINLTLALDTKQCTVKNKSKYSTSLVFSCCENPS